MKKYFLTAFILFLASIQQLWACNVCKKNQPQGLENITHGVGPEGLLDYAISYSATAIVIITLFLSIKYLVRPNENHADHIKNIVLYEKH